MGNRKEIGKLFNEQFKGFEQAPDAGLWDSIASELDQKNDRKIAPFWFYFGGFLVTGLLVGLLYWHPWHVTDTNNVKENSFVLNQNTIKSEKSTTPSLQKDITVGIEDFETENNVSSETINTDTVKNINKEKNPNTKPIISNVITTNNKNTSTYSNNIAKKSESITRNNHKSQNNTISNVSKKSTTPSFSYNDKKKSPILSILTSQTSASQIVKDQKELEAKKNYQTKIKEELAAAIAVQKEENKITLKKWLDSIQLLEASKKADLAIKTKEEEKSSIEKELKLPKTEEERENDRKESVSYKFAISPYTSVLSYGSLTKGSSIDNRLVDNPRDAIGTIGYGVRADYKFSEKSSIRFGIGVTPLQYRTEDFQVLVTNNNNVNIFQLSGINPQNLNQNGGGGIEASPETLAFFNSNDVVSIEQNISYAEVPIDYQYRFLNKRVSMSFNTGLSLFVLTNNRVFATANTGESIFIGRETSLKDLSLALNLGLGTHYNFSKKWRFDVEPAFKYQLNPYTDNIGNFKPYYFGFQFGMSYKF